MKPAVKEKAGLTRGVENLAAARTGLHSRASPPGALLARCLTGK
jgi:hypothetical protein